MKTKILLSTLLAAALCVASAHGQGTLQFTVSLNGANVVPATASPATGTGSFTFDAFGFSGYVFLPPPIAPTGAAIHGPSLAGANANLLFQLEGPLFVPPDSMGDPGGNSFRVLNRTLSQAELNDLVAGLWYVNVLSASFPNGEIRGQIVLVPEPSALALLGLGLAALSWRSRGAWSLYRPRSRRQS